MRMLLPFMFSVVTCCMAPATSSGQCKETSHQDYWLAYPNYSAGCSNDPGVAPIIYKRMDATGQWSIQEESAFLDSEVVGVPTIIFVHGNPTPGYRAHQMGRRMSRLLHERAAGRPFRLVVWYWPDDRKMNRRTAQREAARSDYQAYYLALCVQQMAPDSAKCFVGYSFGSRVVVGALELLAGGSVAGRRLDDSPFDMRPARAMLLGAAMEAHWLAQGQPRGRAVTMLKRLFVSINPQDPAMKFFGLAYRGRGPQALGFRGPTYMTCSGFAEKVELANVSCWVGNQHDWSRYLSAPSFLNRLAWYAHLEPDEQPAEETPKNRP